MNKIDSIEIINMRDYIMGRLEFFFDNDGKFHDLLLEKATATIDSYDNDDVDFLERNATDFLCDLSDEMWDNKNVKQSERLWGIVNEKTLIGELPNDEAIKEYVYSLIKENY